MYTADHCQISCCEGSSPLNVFDPETFLSRGSKKYLLVYSSRTVLST
jgi:hypothetical protein